MPKMNKKAQLLFSAHKLTNLLFTSVTNMMCGALGILWGWYFLASGFKFAVFGALYWHIDKIWYLLELGGGFPPIIPI